MEDGNYEEYQRDEHPQDVGVKLRLIAHSVSSNIVREAMINWIEKLHGTGDVVQFKIWRQDLETTSVKGGYRGETFLWQAQAGTQLTITLRQEEEKILLAHCPGLTLGIQCILSSLHVDNDPTQK